MMIQEHDQLRRGSQEGKYKASQICINVLLIG